MKPIIVTLAALLLSSCEMLLGNKFEITNGTEHELEDVRVAYSDDKIQRQHLGSGETLSFRPSPTHDGGISVSYKENGTEVKHDLGYAAPPISMNCRFEITEVNVLGDCR